jgi:hypothetical protein
MRRQTGAAALGRRRWRHLSWGGLLAALALGGSCYNPDFNRVLYKCGPGYVCPGNLTCIDGKHCTYQTSACTKGGIVIAIDQFVCPGDGNLCDNGFRQCPLSVTTDLCHLDVADSGAPEGCSICCK